MVEWLLSGVRIAKIAGKGAAVCDVALAGALWCADGCQASAFFSRIFSCNSAGMNMHRLNRMASHTVCSLP